MPTLPHFHISTLPHSFSGTGVALVTPFTQDSAIDFDALGRLIEHVIEGGVDYLVALGTTGETPTLSGRERRAVLDYIIQHAEGRVPVVAGMGGNNTIELIHGLHDYDLSKVAGILSVAPYYNKPSQEGIYQHFAAIARATELPIILYNVPGRTASNMLPETVIRLATEFSNIVAVKEASGNIAQNMAIIAGVPEGFAVLSGDDNLVLAQIAVGMRGVISVAANCYTKDFCQMVKSALDGRFSEAREIHYRLLPGMDLLFAEGNPTGVKSVLSRMGICENVLRLPLLPASEGLAEKLAKASAGPKV